MSPERDVFISYAWKDKEFALRLAADLRRIGLKVWIDEWEMKVGDSLNKKIAQGISGAAWLCVVLSPDSVASPWVEKELNAALAQELERRDVFVLPVLYRDCPVPLFLRDKVFADFRRSHEVGLGALVGRFRLTVDPRVVLLLLSGDEDQVRLALAQIPTRGRSAYVAHVRQHFASAPTEEKRPCLTALFYLRDPQLGALLIQSATDPAASVRRHALFLIGQARIRQALSVVSERLSDASPDVRATARDAHRRLTGRAG